MENFCFPQKPIFGYKPQRFVQTPLHPEKIFLAHGLTES